MGATMSVSLMQLSSSGVNGGVTLYATSSMIVGAGWANGLGANLSDSASGGADCTSANACGVHVHSGSTCSDSSGQGGHLKTRGGEDPWTNIRYTSTNAMGWANFEFAVSSDNTDVAAKAFIVHNNAGGRVSCGLLSSDTTPSTTVVTVSTTVTTTAATTTTTITTAT